VKEALERIWKTVSVTISRFLPGMHLGGLRNTTIESRKNNRCQFGLKVCREVWGIHVCCYDDLPSVKWRRESCHVSDVSTASVFRVTRESSKISVNYCHCTHNHIPEKRLIFLYKEDLWLNLVQHNFLNTEQKLFFEIALDFWFWWIKVSSAKMFLLRQFNP